MEAVSHRRPVCLGVPRQSEFPEYAAYAETDDSSHRGSPGDIICCCTRIEAHDITEGAAPMTSDLILIAQLLVFEHLPYIVET